MARKVFALSPACRRGQNVLVHNLVLTAFLVSNVIKFQFGREKNTELFCTNNSNKV